MNKLISLICVMFAMLILTTKVSGDASTSLGEFYSWEKTPQLHPWQPAKNVFPRNRMSGLDENTPYINYMKTNMDQSGLSFTCSYTAPTLVYTDWGRNDEFPVKENNYTRLWYKTPSASNILQFVSGSPSSLSIGSSENSIIAAGYPLYLEVYRSSSREIICYMNEEHTINPRLIARKEVMVNNIFLGRAINITPRDLGKTIVTNMGSYIEIASKITDNDKLKFLQGAPSTSGEPYNALQSVKNSVSKGYEWLMDGVAMVRVYKDAGFTNKINYTDDWGNLMEAQRYLGDVMKLLVRPGTLDEGTNYLYLETITNWYGWDLSRGTDQGSRTSFTLRSPEPLKIIYDSKPPTVTFSNIPANNETLALNSNGEISFTVEDNNTGVDEIKWKVYRVKKDDSYNFFGQNSGEINSGNGFSKLQWRADNKYTLEVRNIDSTEDDDSYYHYLYIYAQDRMGNKNSYPQMFVLDSQPPRVSLTESILEIKDERKFVISGTIDDVSMKTALGKVALIIDNNEIPMYLEYSSLSKDFNAMFYKTTDFNVLKNCKSKNVKFRTTDAAGNISDTPVTLDVDMMPFEVRIDSVVYMNVDYYISGLKLKAKEGSTVNVELDNGDVLVKDYPVEYRDVAIGSFLKKLPEGEHGIKVKIKRNGVWGPEATAKLVVDNASPQVKILEKNIVNDVARLNTENVTINADVTEPSPYSVKFLVDPGSNGNAWSKFDFVDKEVKFPLNIAGLTEGMHDVYILVKDAAGNEGRIKYQIEINRTPLEVWMNPEDVFEGTKNGVVEENKPLKVVFGDTKNGIVLRGVVKNRDIGIVEVKGLRGQYKTAQENSTQGWGIRIPADYIPTKGKTRLNISITDIYNNITNIPVDILVATDKPVIVTDNRVPQYVNKDSIEVSGSILSNADISDLYVQINSDEPIYLMKQGSVIKSSWISTEWDAATKKFKIKLIGLKDNFGKAPYNLMISAKNVGGNEVVYQQEDDSGYTRIPYFWVKTTEPEKPTIKLYSVTNRSAVLEGEAEKGSSVVIYNEQGEQLATTKQVYSDDDKATKGKWQKEVTGLKEGDYAVYAQSVDYAGNASGKAGPVRFTILGVAELVPQITYPADNLAIDNTRYPEIRGTCQMGNATILVFDNGQRIGETVTDAKGNWTFKPTLPFYNGYHNITARIYANYQPSDESQVVCFKLSVRGAPTLNTLVIDTKNAKSFKELMDIPITVKDRKDQPVSSAAVWINENEKKLTDEDGKVYVRAPGVERGKHLKDVTIYAEKKSPTMGTLAGSAILNIYNGGLTKTAFSPNNDGMNDYIVWKQDEVPVKIYNRGNKLIATITADGGYRWDGKMSNGQDAEIGLYYAESSKGQKTFIQLVR